MATGTAVVRRQGGSKTKTGCQTCRIRRIKCDEQKPSCARCVKTGRECDGYTDITSCKSDDRAIAIIQRLSIHTPGTPRERRAFQYFTTQTAPELTGYYETITFWQQLILQASSVDSSLRHAVIAIGTLHEEFANKRLSYYNKVEGKGMGFAINQYTKAIGHLRRSLFSGKQVPLTALMSCILFVCFDSLRGYFDSAMVHLQSGLKILRDVSARCAEESHTIMTQIAPIFKRLSLQAILYIDTRSVPDRRSLVADLADVSFIEEQIPEDFESLAQARHCLNQSADGLFRGFYLCDGDLPMFEQPLEALETFTKYSTQLATWNSAYERFMNSNAVNLTGKELRGAALLKVHHTAATIMGNMSSDFSDPRSIESVMNDDLTFGRFTDEFRIIADLSRTLIKAAELDIENGRPSLTFSTDLGLIGPLYYVCVRCQDHTIRREALELLLRCPRREGMWDSEAGARMIKEFWSIKEQHSAMQASVVGDPGTKSVLADVVDLVFDNEMRWTWKWKSPMSQSSRSSHSSQSSRASRASSASRSHSPDNEWSLSSKCNTDWLV